MPFTSKGITPVISVILLLLVTISIVGFAMIFFTRSVTETSAEAEQQLTKQTQAFGENFEVISIDGNKVYVRNKGTAELKNLAFFVDNNPVPATGAPVAKDGVGTFTLDAAQLAQYPGKKLKVTSAGFSQQEDANFYAKNTVAYWTFDGTDGRTIKDESGNNNHGTFVGETFNDGDLKPSCPNCPAQATGKYGNALRFDGTDDYVEVPDSPSLNQSSPSQNFTTLTFTAWIYVKGRGTHPSGEYIVAKGVNNAPGGGYSLQFDWLQNYSLFFVFTNESGTVTITSAANSVPWNRWTHLAATYNGSNASLYVNGIFADSAAGTGSINTSANPLRVGMRSDYPNVPFNGTIDEVRIYSRALSAAEVAEDMNSAYPIARPVASYSFEKIVSNQVQDTHNVVRGKYGSAISFDGIDDDVTIGGSSFNFGTNTDFTLEAWVSTRRIGNKNVIVKSSGGKYFNMQTNNDVGQTNAIQCQASDGTNTATINSNEAMQNISWVHAACVFDRDALLRTYINGVASATTSMTLIGDLNMPAGTNLYIGIGGAWFNGTIDEVRILNVARS